MKHQGVVTKIIDKKHAEVYFEKDSSCVSCKVCKYGSDNNRNLLVLNRVDARVGDFVELQLEEKNIFYASIIIYLLPLISLMVGVVLTFNILNNYKYSFYNELISAFVGLIFMLISYFIIKKYNKVFIRENRFLPKIVKII